MPSRLTATNLAVHAHLQCDLYLHQAYHGAPSSNSEASRIHEPREPPAAISLAAFTSGNAWESTLFTHLDQLGLLLTNSGPPLSGSDIASIVNLDARSHFFVAGIEFWPPHLDFVKEYAKHKVKSEDVPRFGLAKPDLIEIWREDDSKYVWRVIDAKASKVVKTSHIVQTYFYYLCLKYMLPSFFIPAPTTAVWLPSASPSMDSSAAPVSLATLHSTPILPLVTPLTDLIFTRLPSILSASRLDILWHYNPLCRTCPFSNHCRTRAEEEERLGKAGEISLNDADEVRAFMKLSRVAKGVTTVPEPQETDIEDLIPKINDLTVGAQHRSSELAQLAALLADDLLMKSMAAQSPASIKRVWRILGIQSKNKLRMEPSFKGSNNLLENRSPVVEAALTNKPQFTNRRVYTLPYSEDIAIYISLILDPSRPAEVSSISEFCISTATKPPFSVVAQKYGFNPPHHVHGRAEDLVSVLSGCIRRVLDLHTQMRHTPEISKKHAETDLPRTQFYVWSAPEKDALQKYLVGAALGAHTHGINEHKIPRIDDVRICIGALCEGASLLATTFQPHVLEGALLGFLGKKGKGKAEMEAIIQRLGMDFIEGESAEAMRRRIIVDIEQLGTRRTVSERKIVGLLPRVVVLKKELRKLVALPVPGWWDVREAAEVLGVASASECPDEDELFRRYWHGEAAALEIGIGARNDACRELVEEIRRRMFNLRDRPELLVNRARVLSADWVDVCRVDSLRKLFYMQQFEVLLKLQGLWDARIEGCPDAPILVYRSTVTSTPDIQNIGENKVPSKAVFYLHQFELVAGDLEVAPERDRDRTFFDYILVEDDSFGVGNQLPLETLFDDLSVAGLVFPLNRYTRGKWDEQAKEVHDGGLWIVDIKDVKVQDGRTHVVIRTWSGGVGKKTLSLGRKYRLSPRLVDFNTAKVLSTLVELDLQATDVPSYHTDAPLFTRLISGPKTFSAHGVSSDTQGDLSLIKSILDTEASLHRLYTELRDLGNENAGALVLKASQRRAARRILGQRLTVIWGPPGSGKSYTIALSLLRMLEVQARTHTLAPEQRQIIFVTAMTHAAIHACLSKLRRIIEHYRCVPDLSLEWLDELKMEHVVTGNTHPKPTMPGTLNTRAYESESRTWIYAGTVYQLYTFGKRLKQGVDCVVIDEAGQLGLGSASLVLRALSNDKGTWGGKVVVAGDREQLAPILSGQYPELGGEQRLLFGSVLDCLMGRDEWESSEAGLTGITTPEDKSTGTVVQLLENFRLNPDLGDFVQTIYKRAFRPQKAQTKRVAAQLMRLASILTYDIVQEKGRNILISLSKAMLGKEQVLFEPPSKQDTDKRGIEALTPSAYADSTPTPRPISLAMVNLRINGDPRVDMAYESHVRTEAKVAAALVRLLERACRSEAGVKGDDIFVACPHRIQRSAVNLALIELRKREDGQRGQVENEDEELQQLMQKMGVQGELKGDKNGFSNPVDQLQEDCIPVTVDTIERLQGSEASFVICLFSHTHRGSLTLALPFLLARRRLNVAISRAKNLCIVISSEGVLRPGLSVFANHESARGYAFLRAFEDRAWNTIMEVDLEA